jgi:murein L,D-transpeptidase YcbB/YkuD
MQVAGWKDTFFLARWAKTALGGEEHEKNLMATRVVPASKYQGSRRAKLFEQQSFVIPFKQRIRIETEREIAVKQRGRSQVRLVIVAITGLAMALVLGCHTGSARRVPEQGENAAQSSARVATQQLSPAGQEQLRAMVQSGNLAELRWPNFSDYTKHVTKFYDAYRYALPWVREMQPTAQAQQVIAALLDADQKGLSAEDYDGPHWKDRLAKLRPTVAQPSEADAVNFDSALTICVMRYISDLHIGKVNPKHFDFGFDVESRKYDLPDFLKTNVVAASNVGAALAQVEPPYPGYQRTIQALHTYLELAKQSDGAQLPAMAGAAKVIAPGDSYAGVPQLARFLQLVGDLPANANVPADNTVYADPLVDAVRNFQARHGRTADGRIDKQTLADLNVPLNARVRQMQLTLERWRWLPREYKSAPIVANIPEFRVRAYDENLKVALSMNVVVGKAYGHTTPVFVDEMQYVVFRPYWSVPYSIAKAELLPKLAADPEYLAKKNFEVVDSRQEVVASGGVTGDVLAQLRAGKLFIREIPGPKNSLGLVKFIFPNNYNIYMHDTPAHELFEKSRRDFSHGCIRLERPADMAVWVLRNNPGWDLERVRAAMNGTATQQVNLAKPIPVLIVYGTAIVLEDGRVEFFDDIYQQDAALDKVLEKGYPYPG